MYHRPDVRSSISAGCLESNCGGGSKYSGSTLPVIFMFMTALDDEAMREQAIRASCVAFLRKPFKAHQLIDAIKKAVS